MAGFLINGRRYSYASLEIIAKFGISPVTVMLDVNEISYGQGLDFAYKYGTAPIPLGVTQGNWTGSDGSFVCGESTLAKLVGAIGPGWMQVNFTMNVAYFDIGEPLTVDTILARIISEDHAHAYGPDPLGVTVGFRPLGPILRNGISPMLNRVI